MNLVRAQENYREGLNLLRYYLHECDQNVSRHIESKGNFDEASDRNEEQTIKRDRELSL
jgi:hypothetical protein